MSAINEARSRYRDDGDELEPILTGSTDDPDDFSGLTADQVMKVFNIGHRRKEQLDAVLSQAADGTYRIPHAHKSQYSDFVDQANHNYLHEKYPWLHFTTDYIGIDDDKAEESHGTLEDFMASVPHEDWQQFITDLNGLDDYPLLDEEGASELEMEETNRWLSEDGIPDLIKAMVESRSDSYEAYLLGKVTPDVVYEWLRDNDHYPEADGQGGVWLDMEKLGKDSETQDEFLELVDDDVAGWVAIKRGVYDEVITDPGSGLAASKVSDAFDYMLRQMAAEHESVAYVYNNIDAVTLWEMFLQAFPDEPRSEGDPYWYLWQENYEKPKRWVVGYDAEFARHWSRGYREALEYLRTSDWFIRMIGNWNKRPPEGHPELPFESLVREALEAEPNPDDPETFVRHGGGLREEVIYEDDNIVVMYPRDVETLNHHLRRLGYTEVNPETYKMVWKGNDKDIFVVLGKDHDDLLGHESKREIGVLVGDYHHVKGYDGNYTPQALQNVLTHPLYGASVRKMLLRYYRDQAKHNSNYTPVLLQLGGAKELRRLARYGDLDLKTYGVPLGLHYIDRKKYKLAAKAFNRPPATIDANGVWLIYSDVSDLIGVFKNEEGAQAVFDHETHDWTSHYYEKQNLPAVDDVLKFVTPEVTQHLRTLLTNRRVWFPDGGPDGEGEYVLLTPKLMAGYDDATILEWLKNPSDQDTEDGVFDDIYDEIKLVGADILSDATVDEIHKGYTDAAINAISGSHRKWTENGLEVYVRWPVVKGWSDDYEENSGYPYDGSLEDLAIEQNRESTDPDASNMEASWHDVDKEMAAQRWDRVLQLEPKDAEPLPDDRKQLQMPFTESDDEEARAAALMKEYGVDQPDYDLAKAEADADAMGQTQKHKRNVAQGYLRKMRGESVDPDSPEAMPNMLSGVPVEFEQQVAAILKDSTEQHGYTISDLTIKFETAAQYTDEEIDASDGRLYNRYGPHQRLEVSYVPVPGLDYTVYYDVYRKIRSAAINTFKNYDLIDGYTLNPTAYGLPEDLLMFQYILVWRLHPPRPEPEEPLPF